MVINMPNPPPPSGYSATPSAFAKPPNSAMQYSTPPKPPVPPQNYSQAEAPVKKSTPLLSKVAIVLAIASLLINAYLLFAVFAIKGEAKGMIVELEGIKKAQLTVSVPLKQDIKIQKDILIGSLFSSNVEIPMEFTLPVNGVITGISPQGLPQSFTFADQKIPVKTSVPANITVDKGQGTTIKIDEVIPVDTQIKLTVSAGDAYKTQIDAMIARLQKIAN